MLDDASGASVSDEAPRAAVPRTRGAGAFSQDYAVLRRAGRCRWLLLSLVTILMTYPYVEHRPLAALALTSFVLISGLQALVSEGRAIRFYRLLAGLQIVCSAWAILEEHYVVKIAGVLLLAAFYAVALESVLRFTLSGRRVTVEKLVGAVCGYMLAGFFWAALFRFALLVQPNAFIAPEGRTDVMYFSFVTLTTVGYGDMTAMPGLARSLAIMEGIFGIFYIAVLVSRLVNLAGGGGDSGETPVEPPPEAVSGL